MRTERVTPVFQPLAPGDPATVAGYRIAARLGEGGMGTVYLSYTPGGRPVAIKVIRPELAGDLEFRRRFQLEVQAAQQVQGLYTAPVIDSDTDGERPWLATAYVAGPSLQAAVGRPGPFPVPAVALTVAGIAEALQAIHGVGIMHRDLKPSNVLLSVDGPRVIDFGIARAADATSLTRSGAIVGTPAFMTPEQASGAPCLPPTDVFALGPGRRLRRHRPARLRRGHPARRSLPHRPRGAPAFRHARRARRTGATVSQKGSVRPPHPRRGHRHLPSGVTADGITPPRGLAPTGRRGRHRPPHHDARPAALARSAPGSQTGRRRTVWAELPTGPSAPAT